MFIHIGEREVISDKECVGIFNVETLLLSDENKAFIEGLDKKGKTVAVLADGSLVVSKVSPFTVITRTSIKENKDIIWSKKDVE